MPLTLPIMCLPSISHTYPDVTLAREEPLRDASSIQCSASDIQAGHESQPAYLPHCGSLEEPFRDDKVQGGDDPTKAQSQKHS